MKCDNYIWTVIPVYNHSETLKKIVTETLKLCKNIVVVDDGSTDADITDLLSELDVIVIKHKENRGKGAALRSAAQYITEQKGKYIITLDADGQHDPQDIEHFLPMISEECNTIILGERDFDALNVPEKSKFGRKFSNFWINLETGCEVRDSQSGFRGYPAQLLNDVKCVAEHYAFETEILVRGAWAGMKIENVEISVYYPTKEKRITHFKPFLDNLRISLLHSRLCVEKLFRIVIRNS